MADNNVIDAYIGDVRKALGSYRYKERVLAETVGRVWREMSGATSASRPGSPKSPAV